MTQSELNAPADMSSIASVTFTRLLPGPIEYPESYPTVELEPRGKDVLLTFKHFPILERFIPQNAMGWHTMLDMLAAALNDEPAKSRAEYVAKNAAIYGVDLKNMAR